MNSRIGWSVLVLFLACGSFAWSGEVTRIDGSSDEAANSSFQRMMASLKPDQQQARPSH